MGMHGSDTCTEVVSLFRGPISVPLVYSKTPKHVKDMYIIYMSNVVTPVIIMCSILEGPMLEDPLYSHGCKS